MKSGISVLIVEDHFIQRRKLEELFAKYFPALKIISSCSTFKQAQQAVLEHQPQLWLLDVQLDGNNVSIPLLELGISGSFEVVFITAEVEYVTQNLLSHALATLVKPFSEDKFVMVVNKALQNLTLNKNHNDYDRIAREFRQPEQLKEKIAFRKISVVLKENKEEEEDLIDFILYKNLVWLHSAADHKTNLYYLREGLNATECLTATRSLGEWEEMLKAYGCFERVSRSALINLNYATGFNKTSGKIKLEYISGNAVRHLDFEVEASYKAGLLQHYNSVIKNPF